jgi:hypothetical protein
MTDESPKPKDAKLKDAKLKDDSKWTTSAKVGAAVGSAALVAALMYAGRRSLTQKKGKLEPFSPEPEVEPAPHITPKSETD